MKVFYNSKIAKLFTFMKNFKTIMLFGHIFTESEELDCKVLAHEKIHCLQYKDCFNLGLIIDIVILLILLALNIISWKLIFLLFIPLLLFYIWYGVEYLILRYLGYDHINAYRSISFEKQARWCSEICGNHYKQFGWL